ncbi:MAG: transposase [Anaerolineae bacterium]
MGRPPYHLVVLLKMLWLAYLYDLSERQVEMYVQDSLSARCFPGLAVNERVPDHTTLSVFKERLVQQGRLDCLEALLQEVIRQVQAHGVVFGSIQIVDSTHSVANVNVAKEERRQAEGQAPRDKDARWGDEGTPSGAHGNGCGGGVCQEVGKEGKRGRKVVAQRWDEGKMRRVRETL